MLTVDDRCKSTECARKDIYRMVGKCANCHAEPVLVLFTVGHEVRRVACPSCGVERVYTTRLATPEEIPVA